MVTDRGGFASDLLYLSGPFAGTPAATAALKDCAIPVGAGVPAKGPVLTQVL